MEKIIIIAGPTAIGKTKTAVELAKKIGAEVISADSRQIFKELNIGTAKPKKEDLCGIVHHGFDLVSIKDKENFSVAKFLEFFKKTAADIIARGKNVIVCGGTGLYIDACMNGLSDIPFIDPEIRKKIEKMIKNKGLSFVYEKLKQANPKTKVDKNNPHRIIRAYEVFLGTGKPLTYWQNKKNKPSYEFDLYVLNCQRDKLYDKINTRVDYMFESELIEETKNLSDDEVKKAGIGYDHVMRFLNGQISLQDAKRLMKKDTRHFAKRQLTWFRRYSFAKWVDCDNKGDMFYAN